MDKLIGFWKNPNETFEIILTQKVNWIRVIGLFSCNGIVVVYYLMKSLGHISIESFELTIFTILFLISFGAFYGIVTNFLIGFLIKVTGKFFKGKCDLLKIYTVLSWSFLPFIYSALLIILNILIARVLTTDLDSSVILILSLMVFVFLIASLFLSIWQVTLLFKGLKLAQNFNTTNTILNLISATIIYGIIYYTINHLPFI
tara:strand:- start:184 stop:789 length:606 start_codon:yes stop_codon:yes gene_type:complete